MSKLAIGTLAGVTTQVVRRFLEGSLQSIRVGLLGGALLPETQPAVNQLIVRCKAEILTNAAIAVGQWADEFWNMYENPPPPHATRGCATAAVCQVVKDLLTSRSCLKGVDPNMLCVHGLYILPWPMCRMFFFNRHGEDKLWSASAWLDETRVPLAPGLPTLAKLRYYWGSHPTDEQKQARERLATSILSPRLGTNLTEAMVETLSDRLAVDQDEWAITEPDLLAGILFGEPLKNPE